MPLCRIEHQGQIDVRHQATNQLPHITLAITSHIIYIYIQDVGILLYLVTGNCHQAVPVFLIKQIANFFAATGIEAFTNDQKRVVLVIGGSGVDRGGRCLRLQQWSLVAIGRGAHLAGRRLQFSGKFSEATNVGRGGATTASDHLYTEILHEVH